MALLLLTTSVQARTLVVNQRHPEANDENAGTEDKPFKTISRAAQTAKPGDIVEIRSGIYREHVSPARGGASPEAMITYRARPGHRVVLKGSDVWQAEWKPVKLDGITVTVWRARLDPSLFTYDFPIENFNPFVISPTKLWRAIDKLEEWYEDPVRPAEPGEPLSQTRGMIFADGRPLRQVINPAQFDLTTGAFMVGREGKHILARFPYDKAPGDFELEIVTREQVFAPKAMWLSFIRLKGLTFEHAGTGNGPPQMAMVSATRGKHWIFEDCTFRWSGTGGLDIGRAYWGNLPNRERVDSQSTGKLEFGMIVRRCNFLDNGTAGLWCYAHGRSILVEDCVFERNNWLGRRTWEEGAIKCHGVRSSVFRNNLFRDNDTFALWLDICGPNNRITQNLFINNLNTGVFVEAMAGPTLIDNNIAIGTRPFTYRSMTMADGFYNHQSSNVIFAHNLSFGNAGYGFRNVLHR